MDIPPPKVVLYREDQRVSLRAFLRTFLQNKQIAESAAMVEFLTSDPVNPNEEEMDDIKRRKEMDEKRVEEQRRFYEIARERARELDVYMERFRRDIVESSMYLSLQLLLQLKTLQMVLPSYSARSRRNHALQISALSTRNLPSGYG